MTRTDERRQARDYLKLLEAGIVRERTPKDYVLALARHLERLFRRAQAGAIVDEPVDFVFSFLNASAGRAWPDARLVRQKGCAFCCHL